MRIAAFQFPVTGDVRRNYEYIRQAVLRAAESRVRFLVFPECALTGYPPRDFPSSAAVDDYLVGSLLQDLQKLTSANGLSILVGAIVREKGRYYNRAVLLSPDGKVRWYDKRALWGWDRDNFAPGTEDGVFTVDGVRIGVRICFEIRFPEYFRELYRAKTDFNVVLFYDVSDRDDTERFDLIRGHIRTRAVENVTHLLAVNSAGPFQTAPTALYDCSGRTLAEFSANETGLLCFDFEPKPLDFGEQGRKAYSDSLV